MRSNDPLSNDEAELALRIMRAAPARDLVAETELYRALAPRIRLYGLKHLRDAHAAHDLVQDVMLMTLERLQRGEIREPERIASFVLGTSRQTVLDRKRSLERRQRLLEMYANDVPIAASATPPAFDVERLQLCLQLLPERERSVVLMSFFDASSADEVARALGISAANVRVIRCRGIEHLRQCLHNRAVRRA